MEVNLVGHSFIPDHVVSALKGNCVICINGKRLKDLLVYYIIIEFTRQTNKSSAVLYNALDSKGYTELKNWIGLHSNLGFLELSDIEELSNSYILPKNIPVYTVPMDSVLISSRKELIEGKICLLIFDLTCDHLCESLLKDVTSIMNFFSPDRTRFIVLLDISTHLNCFKKLKKVLSMCYRGLPAEIKFASDTVAIGRNGNLIETKTIEILNTVVPPDPLFHPSYHQFMEDCKDAISFYLKIRSTCKEGNDLLNELNSIAWHLKLFGTMAFSIILNRFDELVQSKINSLEQPGELILILKLLRTKMLVLKATIGFNLNYTTQVYSISLALKRGLNCVKELFVDYNRDQTDKRRAALAVESDKSAEVLYLILHKLKSEKDWRYLDKCSIFMINENWQDGMILNNDAIFVTCVQSSHLHRLKLDMCISFCVPFDYCMLLDIKRSLKRRNGTLHILVPWDDNYIGKLEKIDDFGRTEATILNRMPSYINPSDVMMSSLFVDHGLFSPFEPHGMEYQISPEEAISVVNRYCNFLKSGMSRSAIDYDFSIYRDESNISIGDIQTPCSEILSAQTKIFLPLKSMVRVPVQAPIVKLPCSKDVRTKLRLLSRVASCLEVCKILYEENHDIFASMMTKTKTCKNHTIANDNVLTQNKVNRKEIPALLKGSFPRQNSLMFIYVVNTRKRKGACYEPFQKHLGFCCTKPLKKFPSFLIYNRAKRLVKSICKVNKCQILTDVNYQPMYNFHVYILRTVLGYEVLDNEADSSDRNQCNGILWTVLKQEDGCYNIDYEFLEEFRVGRTEKEIGFLNTNPTSFSCNDFKDKVISPVHRSNLDVFYFVKDVRKDILIHDELSCHSNRVTFKNYYQSKYGITLNPDQFMIEVLPVHKYLNFLESRYREKGSPHVSKRRQETILPSELCLAHRIPAHLWGQIVAIPVLLHRISSILYLDELGHVLMKELNLDEPDEGPCVDENIYTVINQIHKGKDRMGLQRVEDTLTGFSGVRYHDSILRKKFALFDADTEKGHIGEVDNCPMKDKAQFEEIKGYGIENQLYINKEIEDSMFFSGLRNKKDKSYATVENTDLNTEKKLAKYGKEKMPPLSLMLVAGTSADAQDMFSYERLEFLGDAFLAFSIAAELFLHNKRESDSVLSRQKSGIVSNIELCAKGYRRKLWKYIVANNFDFRCSALVDKLLNVNGSKTVDCQCRNARLHNEIGSARKLCSCEIGKVHSMHTIADPCLATDNPSQDMDSDCFKEIVRNSIVADCIETHIGLFYVNNGAMVTLNLMNWLGFDVCCVRKMQLDSRPNIVDTETRAEYSPPRTDSKVTFAIGQERDFGCHRNQGADSGLICTKVELLPRDVCRKALNACETDYELEGQIDIQSYSNTGRDVTISQMKLKNNHVQSSSYVSQQLLEFEKILKYEFADKNHLLEALLHPSYPCRFAPAVNCNERLEFLGDSILYLLVADYICRRYPKSTNAELTDMRSIIVNTKNFAKVAYLHGFHRFLMIVSAGFSEQLLGWSTIIEAEREDGNLWPKWSMSNLASFHESPLPKLSIPKDLADVFESVAGAIFVDSGRLDLVWQTFYSLLKDSLDSLP